MRSARSQTIVICFCALETVRGIIAEHHRFVTYIIILYYYKIRDRPPNEFRRNSPHVGPVIAIRVADGIGLVPQRNVLRDAAATKNNI